MLIGGGGEAASNCPTWGVTVLSEGSVRFVIIVCVFFFKQEAAYEVRLGLVGSEMGIRGRAVSWAKAEWGRRRGDNSSAPPPLLSPQVGYFCFFYTHVPPDHSIQFVSGGPLTLLNKNSFDYLCVAAYFVTKRTLDHLIRSLLSMHLFAV